MCTPLTAPGIVTSNRGFEQEGEILGDAMVAANLIDRLVHHATMISLQGKSYANGNAVSTSRPPLDLHRFRDPLSSSEQSRARTGDAI